MVSLLRTSRATAKAAVVALALVMAASLSLWGTSSSGASPSQTKSASTTLQIWLGGLLTTATPGSLYRHWVNVVTSSFESKYRGTKVDLTLLPADNGQLA